MVEEVLVVTGKGSGPLILSDVQAKAVSAFGGMSVMFTAVGTTWVVRF